MGTLSEIKFLQSLEKNSSPKSTTFKDECLPDINHITEWDTVMKMPLAHLTFLCEALFPAHLFDGIESQHLYTELEKVIKTILEEIGVSAEIAIGGDPVDGLTIPNNPELNTHSRQKYIDQIDILLVIPDVSVGPTELYQINPSEDKNGFHIVSPTTPEERLNAMSFTEMQRARDKVDEAVRHTLKNRYSHRVNIAVKYCSQKYNAAGEQTPQKATCHVIPTEDPALWTYSLHENINLLSKSLTPKQRQAFAMIKILILDEFDVPAVITLEHARMVFFNACKCVTVLSITGLTQLLGLFFHQLLSCLLNFSLPPLFLPQLNLLNPTPSEDILQTVIDKLVNIRQLPMTYILKHYPKTAVQLGISPEELLKMIDPVIEDSKSKTMKTLNQSIANVIVPSGQKLICTLVAKSLDADPSEQTNLMKRAFNLCEVCNRMWNSVLTGQNLTIKALNLFTAFKFVKPIKAAIRLYEHTLDSYGSYGNELNDLACMYHAFIHTLPVVDQEEVIQKTKQLFEKVFSTEVQEGKKYDSYTDYCTFLCRMNMHEEALKYLQIQREKKDEDLQIRHSYGMEECDTVDEHIQQEIDHSSEKIIRVASGIYTRYLMAQCYFKLERQEEVQPLVNEMLRLIDQIQQNEVKALHLNMVGYIYFDTGLYDDAIQVFLQVLEITPDKTTAEEYLLQCQALKLSLEV